MKITMDRTESHGVVAVNIDGNLIEFTEFTGLTVEIQHPTHLEPLRYEYAGCTLFKARYDNDHAIIVTLDGRRLHPDELLLRDEESWVRYRRTEEQILVDVGYYGPPTLKARLEEGDLETGIICTDEEQRDAARRIGLAGGDDP